MTAKRVLIFGTTGEIGSRIARGCVEAGHSVVGVSRGTNTRPYVDNEGVELVHGDKADAEFVASLAHSTSFDTVIDTVTNIPNLEIYQSCFRDNLEHFFMCSSTGVYPPLQYLAGDENHPWRESTGVNFDFQSDKDAYALELWDKQKFPATVFRATCILGEGRIPLDLWGGRNPLFFKKMKASEVIDTPVHPNTLVQAGENTDLASAFVIAVSKGPEINGEIFNISSRKAITLERYFNVAKRALNSNSTLNLMPTEEFLQKYPEVSAGGVEFLAEHMCFDIRKVENILGYSPKFSTEEALTIALNWCINKKLI